MNEIGLDWYSKTGNVSIEIVQKMLIAHDEDINEMLKLGVAVGFGKPVSDLTENIEKRFSPMCRKALLALHSGVGEEARTPHNLPLFTFLAFVGVTIDCVRAGNTEAGMDMLFTSGIIWGEIESNFRWKTDAYRGQKVAGGARNSAIQTNSRHIDLRGRRMKRMAELTQTMPATSASYQCEIEGLGSAEAVRKTWSRHKNNWDT